MRYAIEEYSNREGDLQCPVCETFIIPKLDFEGIESTSHTECGHCLNTFNITAKIIEWKDVE
jgi:hypothetical protein